MTLWRVLVRVSGEPNYTSNGVTFGSEEKAKEYARDLARRWTAVLDWRVEPIDQANKTPVIDGRGLDSFGPNETIRPRDNVRNPLADCMRVVRLLGQADALGYVGEQAAPIMEEALSLASDILKREVK
jgi:hypothetical protein